MRFNRKKTITTIVILCVLLFAFWYGGNAPGLQGWNVKLEPKNGIENIVLEDENTVYKEEPIDEEVMAVEPEEAKEEIEDELDENIGDGPVDEKDKVEQPKELEKEGQESRHGGNEGGLSASEKVELAKKIAGGSSTGVDKGSISYSESMGMEIDSKTGRDKYLTDPVPEGKPIPMEPQNTKITDIESYATLSVRCDTILENLDWLDPDKIELVPEDGVIFATKKVKFYEGESVFNLLLREMKKAKIHMEFSNTPMYNSAYIEGINNLYEFDCGELSGWMYKVNGWFPNYGSSRYALKEGDIVEWVYTCNLGFDVRGLLAIGGE